MTISIKQQGMVLLYALLVASIVLVIGLTLSNIILKQLIISSISREMNNAYYAANAARECTEMLRLTYDKKKTDNVLAVASGVAVTCGEETYNLDSLSIDSDTLIQISYPTEAGLSERVACGLAYPQSVIVYQDLSGTDYTNIHVARSQGYNTDCDVTESNRKVERVLCQDFDLADDGVGGDGICAAER